MAVRKGLVRVSALAGVGCLALTGCLSSGGDGGGGGAAAGGAAGDTTVEIMYGFGQDQDRAFQASVKPWADSQGITMKFSPTPDFDKIVRSRVQGNNQPDIAMFPQPGIALGFAAQGKLQPLDAVVDLPALQASVVPGLLDSATAPDGKIYASPVTIGVKSLVWYPKKAFEAAGYAIPKTQAELIALQDQIKADGTPPWCVGIEAAAATGWMATDWFEDYVLRFGGPDKYDQWVKHEIPFNDPLALQAGQEIEKMWFPEGNVLGGRQAILSTPVGTAGNPMFDEKPKCFMARLGSFVSQPGSFPPEVLKNIDTEAGVFQLPPIEPGDTPLLGGGDLAGAFNADENTKKVMAYITGPEFGGPIIEGGQFSPHKNFDISKYPNQTLKDIAEIAYSASEIKFDGSDQMPGEVGAGSFWRGMVTWVQGTTTLEETLTAIQDSWPTS